MHEAEGYFAGPDQIESNSKRNLFEERERKLKKKISDLKRQNKRLKKESILQNEEPKKNEQKLMELIADLKEKNERLRKSRESVEVNETQENEGENCPLCGSNTGMITRQDMKEIKNGPIKGIDIFDQYLEILEDIEKYSQ